MSPAWISTTLLFASAFGLATAHRGHAHEAIARRLVPAADTERTWYHQEETEVHKLFRRGPLTDGVTYPQVGSPTWSSPYPTSTPDSNAMPQVWKDALAAAEAAGKIPNIPPTTIIPNQNPQYPTGVDPSSPQVCSSTVKCRTSDVIWDAPDGQVGISFDDGPIPGSSDVLYDFLQQNTIQATHFFIGVNILAAPSEFTRAYEMGGDIAVHTWTHPYMTSLSNADVVAQLGWTIQIIHNSTGGLVPRFWRPPYGDADNRVFAIAKEIFGLTTVIWNQDTEDWSMATTSLTLQTVENSLTKWYSGAKSPGLIILEHELTNNTVQAFIDTIPKATAAGWQLVSVARLDNQNHPYSNVDGTGAPALVNDVFAAPTSSSTPSSAAPASTSGSTASSQASAKSSTGSGSTSGSGLTSSSTSGASSNSTSGSSGAAEKSASGALDIAVPVVLSLLGASTAAVLSL